MSKVSRLHGLGFSKLYNTTRFSSLSMIDKGIYVKITGVMPKSCYVGMILISSFANESFPLYPFKHKCSFEKLPSSFQTNWKNLYAQKFVRCCARVRIIMNCYMNVDGKKYFSILISSRMLSWILLPKGFFLETKRYPGKHNEICVSTEMNPLGCFKCLVYFLNLLQLPCH